MESIWSKTVDIPKRESLNQNITVDAAVIGAGLAGILTAYFLQQRGLNTVILEANRIASGQTQNTTAKITLQHDLFYQPLIKNFGKNKAMLYAKANSEAIEDYANLIDSLKIDCDFERVPSYLYSTQRVRPLKEEYEAASSLGIAAKLTTETMLPFSVKAALKYDNQAQFNPLKFIKKLSESLTIYENTKALSVDKNVIDTGTYKVNAKHIIFATHYPFINAPGYYFIRMHQERSYVIAVENAAQLDGLYYSIEKSGYSLRNYQNLLLIGGGGHRTGENSKGGKYAQLRRAAHRYYPDYKEIAAWSAQDCMTLDDVPYIGKYSSSEPDWYVATGFKKWGMTTSMVAAHIISDMIFRNDNVYEKLFTPQRFKLSASAKKMLEEGKQSVKGLTREMFAMPKEKIEGLQKGHGGVVEYNGEKFGVYKDNEGETFIVSAACSHLGCQLEFNPDEKSWDCPCHGSRFDYKGNLLNNPANENIII